MGVQLGEEGRTVSISAWIRKIYTASVCKDGSYGVRRYSRITVGQYPRRLRVECL